MTLKNPFHKRSFSGESEMVQRRTPAEFCAGAGVGQFSDLLPVGAGKLCCRVIRKDRADPQATGTGPKFVGPKFHVQIGFYQIPHDRFSFICRIFR